jgi:hypothetical protein
MVEVHAYRLATTIAEHVRIRPTFLRRISTARADLADELEAWGHPIHRAPGFHPRVNPSIYVPGCHLAIEISRERDYLLCEDRFRHYAGLECVSTILLVAPIPRNVVLPIGLDGKPVVTARNVPGRIGPPSRSAIAHELRAHAARAKQRSSKEDTCV